MAYFNHAFSKVFVGTAGFTELNTGMLGTAGNILAKGEFAFVDPTTWNVLGIESPPKNCCPLILASGSLYQNDKVGPQHGGYQESNKSKMINPKYVNRFYKVEACDSTRAIVNIGSTSFTAGGGVLTYTDNIDGTGYTDSVTEVAFATTSTGAGTGLILLATVAAGIPTITGIANPGIGYVDGVDVVTLVGGNNDATASIDSVSVAAGGTDCCKEFLCGETYHLRIDVKGSPALRFLNHNVYQTLDAYTGCCADDALAPVAVDSTLVMITWAQGIIDNPLVSEFLLPVVSDQTGVVWYAPGTDAAFLTAQGADTWDNYVSPGYIEGACAGLILNGAYIDTKFGDCTFQQTDFYEKEPLRIYASEVDLNGDPCTFEGLCIVDECLGSQAMGLGESVARDVIMSESYRQNFFHTDLRIREITQGNQILDVIDRLGSYDRYYIQHSVPRFNNPTGTFDNDQYLLEIIVDAGSDQSEFELFVETWLGDCSQCNSLEVISCLSACEPTVLIPGDGVLAPPAPRP
jgi:hypothetical protein